MASGPLAAPGARRIVAVAAAVVVFAVAALAATGGSIRPFEEGTGGWRVSPGTASTEEVETDQTITGELEEEDRTAEPNPYLQLIARLLVVTLLLVCVYIAIRVLLNMAFARRSGRRRNDDELVDAELAPTGAATEMAEALDEGLRSLDELAVDDAIIACWVRLEAAASDAGVGRRPSETATELTVRVLASRAVSAAAIERLLALYREARFSEHTMSGAARDEARDAFLQLRRELTAGVPA